MWTLVLKLGLWLLGCLGLGKPDPEKTGEQVMAGKEAQDVLAEGAAQQRDPAPVTDRVRDETYRD